MKLEWRMSLAAACGAVVVAALSGFSAAAEPAKAPATPAAPAAQQTALQPAPAADWFDEAKQPTKWFKWGADERIRQEYIHNPFLTDADPPGHEWNNLRVRTRVWASVMPCEHFDVNVRLTNEMRYWFTPDSRPANNVEGYSELRNASGNWDYSDVLFDNANFRLKNLFDSKSTLTVGRQDFLTDKGAPAFGDGWLILDGTPIDGSRTIYFDAVRLNVDLEQAKTNLDLVFIQQYSDPDAWLPPINSESYPPLMEQDERGAILYARNKSIERTQIDGYFIYKHDNAQWPNGDEGDIYTVGSRVAHDFDKNWRGTIEGAYQFGSRHNPALFGPAKDNDLSAWGMNSKLTYAFNDEWKNRLFVGLEMLSGDDADSGTNGQFDPLWARWPAWSELYIYSYASETRIAETTNLIRPSVGWLTSPTSKMDFSLSYHPLWAFENTRHDQGRPGFGDDNFRGHLIQAVLKYRFNKHVATHLWAEYFSTGDFYESAPPRNTDDLAFLRWEVLFTF